MVNTNSDTAALLRAKKRLQAAKVELEKAEQALKDASTPQRDWLGIDDAGSGRVIKFKKQYNGPGSTEYTFAAIKWGKKWFLTQSQQFQKAPMTDDELKKFIGNGRAWIMSLGREVPRV